MKRTLLSLVQNILSAIDGDEVNSIGDTVEAMQVAEVIRETYEEIVTNLDIPEHKGLLTLESESDILAPNYMYLKDDVKSINWIKYKGKTIIPLTNEQFFDKITLVESEAAVNTTKVTDPESGIQYWVTNDEDPKYFTVFDDMRIVFNSYKESDGSTLLMMHTMAYGEMYPRFHMEDDFIPDLDANLFPLLLAEAKQTAFINIKQVSSAQEEKKARRQRVRAQRNLSRIKREQRVFDYGRKR